jgi:hypothetical protein
LFGPGLRRTRRRKARIAAEVGKEADGDGFRGAIPAKRSIGAMKDLDCRGWTEP